MERYICIHGHFYQPPRENPWLETIEVQDSAYPYHDWNERIAAECYEPNSTARILDGDGHITKIINNYAQISFNFGPTLLSWLEEHAPRTYRRILEADRQSQDLFEGHGNALAQVYNHIIMPLANERDKITQVRWGIRDFLKRFDRMPEGMWLAETAVDIDTLEVLAAEGIKYTVLAPNQASEVRAPRARNWTDVSGSRVDPTMPYEVRLPSKRKLTVFFYDGPISRGIAFEGLLTRGENLAHRLESAFSDQRDWPQLVHIATDGESYGHHHAHGDMALAYAVEHIREHQLATLTNYGMYLEKHPPTHEARIFDNSAWSCAHGIERWRSDCGCNAGGGDGWTQKWRGPLRDALDWLRDELAPKFEEMGSRMFKDPWEARNDYIEIVMDHSKGSVQAFFDRHAGHRLGTGVESNALCLLEMQRQCLLMYTSCGWFFDELSGIETVQIMAYAGRAIQLAEYLFKENFETEFLNRLELAKSNLPQHQNGKHIYEKFVRPSKVDLMQVGAHFAVSSLFEEYQQQNQLFCYKADVLDFHKFEAGRAKLALGNFEIRSDLTGETARINFGVLHMGDHVVHGGVQAYDNEADYQDFVRRVTEPFHHAEFAAVIGVLDREFSASVYSLRSLFRDEQRKILDIILDDTPAELAFRQVYQTSTPLMSFLAGLGAPSPKPLLMAAEYVLNLDLLRELEGNCDLTKIERLRAQAKMWEVPLDAAGLSRVLEQKIQSAAIQLEKDVHDSAALSELDRLATVALSMPFEVKLHTAQNVYYGLLQSVYPTLLAEAKSELESKTSGSTATMTKKKQGKATLSPAERFRALGQKLRVNVP